MVDTYTEVTKQGYFGRIGKAFKGIATGLLLFIGSFVLLFWNEGRVNLAGIAENAVEFNAVESADAALDGQLVSAFGTLATDGEIGDGRFLAPGNYLQVNRDVEVYAWVEESRSETETKLGGSQETKTTYHYQRKWVKKAPQTSSFKIPRDHKNFAKTIEDVSKNAEGVMIGNYGVDSGLGFPGMEGIALTEENVMLDDEDDARLEDGFVFVGRGTQAKPWVGDMRISYSAVPSPQSDISVLGKLSGQKVMPFFDDDGNKVYRAIRGDKDAAVSQLDSEHSRSTWILRLVGFLMMWIGLSSIFGVISVLLDVIPLLGSISRGAIKTVMLVVSLVLTVVTIIISSIIHNIWALMAVVLLLVVGGWFMVKKKMAEEKGKPAAPKPAA